MSATRRVAAARVRLDDLHVLVAVDWTTGAPLALSSMFLLRRNGDAYQPVVYLNHHDVAEALRPGGTEQS